MILFQPEHVEMILDGHKTQTRRLGRKRWNIGSVRQLYLQPPISGAKPFAKVRIINVRWEEQLGDITLADARAEGYDSIEAYMRAFRRIYKLDGEAFIDALHKPVWVIDFEVIQ